MDESKLPSISPQDLYGAIGTADAPVLIKARRSGACWHLAEAAANAQLFGRILIKRASIRVESSALVAQ
jgi:hypothetical protein